MSTAGPGDSTRDKILHAAELLFAADGFDRVTLRQIAREADQRNVAAVQYHFGSKAGLLAEIVDGHRTEIDGHRAELLAKAEANGTDTDLSTLMSILVDPLATKLDSPAGRAYLRIQAQGLTNAKMRPATRSLIQRMGQHLGQHLSQHLGQHSGQHSGTIENEGRDTHRARFALLLLFHALADRASQETSGRAKRNDRTKFVAALTRALRGVFEG